MWSLDYVQVPKEEKVSASTTPKKEDKQKKESENRDSENVAGDETDEAGVELTKKRIQSLVQQMSVSAELTNTEEGLIIKSGSESSLSDDDKNLTGKESNEKEEKERCSGKEDEDENDDEKDNEKNIFVEKDLCDSNELPPQFRKKFDYGNRSKSEDQSGSLLLEEPKYNVWRRPSCRGDLHRQEAFQEGIKFNAAGDLLSIFTLKKFMKFCNFLKL